MKHSIFAACILLSITATAQRKIPIKFSIGAEFAGVTGNLNTVYSIAAGGTAQVDFSIDKDAAITVNTGIIDFVGKTINGTDLKYRSVALIPLLAGVKYYFIPKLYGSAQIGASFSTRSGASNSSSFTYAPGVGYKIDEKLDVLLKYTGYSSNGGSGGGTFGIRLGYSF